MNIYISGALAGAKDLNASVHFYERVAAFLELNGFRAHLPHRSNHPSAHGSRSDLTVFGDDVEALVSADVCVARLDEPSLGVGAEIALALERGVPVIAYHNEGIHVSRFVTGLIRKSGGPNSVLTYSDAEDLFAQLKEQLAGITASR